MIRGLFLSAVLVLAGTVAAVPASPATSGSLCGGPTANGERVAKSCPRGYRPCAPGCCPAS